MRVIFIGAVVLKLLTSSSSAAAQENASGNDEGTLAIAD